MPETIPGLVSPETPQDIVAQYPAIELLADARSYADTGNNAANLSGEQLRTAKSISVLRKIATGDVSSLLGANAEALRPGYVIYRDIVQGGITTLGEGDTSLGQHRMEAILSIHDIAKSSVVAAQVEGTYGITDHDMALAALVGDNFNALEGAVEPGLLDGLRATVSSDPALRGFFQKERGIDPGFNVGRHLQGEADFTLFKRTVHEVDPVSMAEFTLDLLGSDGNINPNGPVKFSNIPPAFNGIAAGLKKLTEAQASGSSPEDTYAIWQELAYPSSDLERLGLNRSDAENIALTRLAFMGREHQKGDPQEARDNISMLRTTFDSLDLGTKQEIVEALQDNAGLDIGFAPHVTEALRQKVGTGTAYKHLLEIMAHLCEADAVRSRSAGTPLTINLNNKFDWSNINAASNVQVTLSKPDTNGIMNAGFSLT